MSGTRVYVGGLPHDVRERDLERFFKGYGRTREIVLKNGYAFVEFDDQRDADDAAHELNGKRILERRVVVELAKRATARGGGQRDRYGDRDGGRRGGGRYNENRNGRSRFGPPQRTEYRLIVENLSSQVGWQDLKDYMRNAGEVTYADAHKLRRGEGVIDFATEADMKKAIVDLDDSELSGRRIRLVEDRQSGGRSGRGGGRDGRGRSRSRSRSSSRSRSRSRKRSRSKSIRSSRSKSPQNSQHKSKSRSRSDSRSIKRKYDSRSRSNSKRVSRSRSKSPGAQRHKSKIPMKSRSPSRSRSVKSRREVSHSRTRSCSSTRSVKHKRNSRSRSHSKARSASPGHKKSHSRSRSRSRSALSKDSAPDEKNKMM